MSVDLGPPREGVIPRPARARTDGQVKTIRDINPSGNDLNCGACAILVDEVLGAAGKPKHFRPVGATNSAMPRTAIERAFKKQFSGDMDMIQSWKTFSEAPDGSRWIVLGTKTGSVSDTGHYLNVVKQNGVVRFIDGQTGTGTAVFPMGEYSFFKILQTK